MSTRNHTGLTGRLAELAGSAPVRKPNVRTLARFAANSGCSLASVGFAARVDFDRLLRGIKRYEVPFGQSPFAFRRGNLFEERLRDNKTYAPLRTLLGEVLGSDPDTLVPKNLRGDKPKDRWDMEKRAEDTRAEIQRILRREPGAPNLLDGAVLTRTIGGVPAYFEADAVAAHAHGPIHAGEVKSFPTVDGQADPEKVGAAIAQVSIYLLLLRDLVADLGGDPDRVSSQAFLITPRNTGLQPILTEKEVGREVDRASRILAAAPDAKDLAESLPGDLPSFETVWKKELPEQQRLDAAGQLVETVGTRYAPECLSTCGLSRFCRERAQCSGDPARVGGQLVRLLPGVKSIDRASALARGAEPDPEEVAVAHELRRAAGLLENFAGVAPRSRRAGGRSRR